jgi:ribosome-associated toxin RatA of RatAB toxin-antitoxin module
MFELVNNIEDYPRFLPWCRSSHVKKISDTEIEARLDIFWKGITKSFTTRNYLHPFQHMEIKLVTGPFRHLEGRWSFIELSGDACKVGVELEFEFTGSMFDVVFQPIFNHIANSLVEAFSIRAAEVYGQS